MKSCLWIQLEELPLSSLIVSQRQETYYLDNNKVLKEVQLLYYKYCTYKYIGSHGGLPKGEAQFSLKKIELVNIWHFYWKSSFFLIFFGFVHIFWSQPSQFT